MGIQEDEIKLLIEKAQQRMLVAIRMFDEGYLEDAINRAYYAVFYVALAVLLTKGVRTRRHSTALSLFGYHLVRTGEIEKEYAKTYRKLREIRESADYEICVFFEEEVKEAVEHAKKFVKRMKEYLRQKGILN